MVALNVRFTQPEAMGRGWFESAVFLRRRELAPPIPVTLIGFINQRELWKIDAMGSILPIAHARLALCSPPWSAVGTHYTRPANSFSSAGLVQGLEIRGFKEIAPDPTIKQVDRGVSHWDSLAKHASVFYHVAILARGRILKE